MGKKSGDTVPSRYLDSKFKKVTQEIKHYRYLAHTRTCVSKIFTSYLLPSFCFARFCLICVSTRNCGLSAVGICCAIVYIGLDHPGSDRIHGHMTIIGKPSFVPTLHTAMHMSKSRGSHVLCTWGSKPLVRHCNVYFS